MSAGLQGAIESAPVSRLHEHRSYDPADFGVPPVARRSGGSPRCAGCAACTPILRRYRRRRRRVEVDVDPAPEVKTSSAERSVAHAARTFIPADRVSAQAYASFDEATVITVPAQASASRPTVVTVTGHGGAGYGHLLVHPSSQVFRWALWSLAGADRRLRPRGWSWGSAPRAEWSAGARPARAGAPGRGVSTPWSRRGHSGFCGSEFSSMTAPVSRRSTSPATSPRS